MARNNPINGNGNARESREHRAMRAQRSRLAKPESAAFDAMPDGAIVATEDYQYTKLGHQRWTYTDKRDRTFETTLCPPLRAVRVGAETTHPTSTRTTP
jgi:hypothetical protein